MAFNCNSGAEAMTAEKAGEKRELELLLLLLLLVVSFFARMDLSTLKPFQGEAKICLV